MKKKGVIIGVIIAVIVIIAVSIIGSYNGLISLEESTNTAYSDIPVSYTHLICFGYTTKKLRVKWILAVTMTSERLSKNVKMSVWTL